MNTIQRRSLVGTLAALLIAVPCAQAQSPLTAPADSQRQSAPRLRCYRGKPAPACHTFVITELGYYPVLWSSSATYARFASDTARYRVKDFGSHGAFEIGMMRNTNARTAVGATVLFGIDPNGTRYGAKLRYRRWLTPDGLSADFATGVVSGTFREFSRTTILTGDAALNISDYGALVARVEMARAGARTPSALYGGVRLGSKPGLIASGLTAISALVLLVALSSWTNN